MPKASVLQQPGRSTPRNTGAFGSELSVSPGRLINLRNGMPLLTAEASGGEFLFNGNTLFVIGKLENQENYEVIP